MLSRLEARRLLTFTDAVCAEEELEPGIADRRLYCSGRRRSRRFAAPT